MTIGLLIGISLAGGLGAAMRYVTDFIIAHHWGADRPWGTWFVNVLGAGALGMVAAFADRGSIEPGLYLILAGGLLGSFTTFSTWMVETVRLIAGRAYRAAIWNLLGTLAAGIAAFTVVFTLTRLALS